VHYCPLWFLLSIAFFIILHVHCLHPAHFPSFYTLPSVTFLFCTFFCTLSSFYSINSFCTLTLSLVFFSQIASKTPYPTTTDNAKETGGSTTTRNTRQKSTSPKDSTQEKEHTVEPNGGMQTETNIPIPEETQGKYLPNMDIPVTTA
jgi:hypothetical protein